MKTNILGYPRIGASRELKRAEEAYWAGKVGEVNLLATAKELRARNWKEMAAAGVDLVPCNDFSLYDHVLDMIMTLGAIPERYAGLEANSLQQYFAMARGIQDGSHDIIAMEMTKWFDTNYHYIVPELHHGMRFSLFADKVLGEVREAKAIGVGPKPVLTGPVSFLLLGKAREEGFDRLRLLESLLPVYAELLALLKEEGVEWVQMDEPFLSMDLDEGARLAFAEAYAALSGVARPKMLLTTYFGELRDNLRLAAGLPAEALHVDMVRGGDELERLLGILPHGKALSLGVVDGRSVWRNNFDRSLGYISKARMSLGDENVFVGASSSFLHVPYDLEAERGCSSLPEEVFGWLAFAKQKTEEVVALREIAEGRKLETLAQNREARARRRQSALVNNDEVRRRTAAVGAADARRRSAYAVRAQRQAEKLGLPLYPTTTIGSFPQTKEVRGWRLRNRRGELSDADYKALLEAETARCIRRQEEMGLDVLVHGEFERNDMVEYFGERLDGFAFTSNGWVQSYGARCVKPPIIYGDVSRPRPMTVEWARYSQSLTSKPVKGMLTGPVTIVEWSFVRDDQPRSATALQVALAIRDEVSDLEAAGIGIIQIDEPAIREGLPLRRSDWQEYLDWAVTSFKVSSCGVGDETQIHTHMCYSEFGDIIESIAEMDADVITIECSRSQMELLDVFGKFSYPNAIGPGVYDIHSPRIPSESEIAELLRKASAHIPKERLWVNPDCGLKTREWPEVEASLRTMVNVARAMRQEA